MHRGLNFSSSVLIICGEQSDCCEAVFASTEENCKSNLTGEFSLGSDHAQ